MKIKVMFPEHMDKSDVQIYMEHGALSDAEKKKLKEQPAPCLLGLLTIPI